MSDWVDVIDKLPKSIVGNWSDEVYALCDQGMVWKLSYFNGKDGGCWQRSDNFVNAGSKFITHWKPIAD